SIRISGSSGKNLSGVFINSHRSSNGILIVLKERVDDVAAGHRSGPACIDPEIAKCDVVLGAVIGGKYHVVRIPDNAETRDGRACGIVNDGRVGVAGGVRPTLEPGKKYSARVGSKGKQTEGSRNGLGSRMGRQAVTP